MKVTLEAENSALAMALYNLCVRNKIDFNDMIKTMKQARKDFEKNIKKLRKETK